MAKFLLTNKAVEDLTNIWNYTYDTWSERQADIYYQSLLNTCQEIANNTNLGKAYPEIEPSLRGVNINKHIIFYRQLSDDEVEITRILHEMMDLKNRVKE